MADKKLVLVEKNDSIALVTLNRPEAFNAFHLGMITEVAETLTDLVADRAVRAIVLTGAGKAFCGGGDLKWMLSLPEGPAAAAHKLAGQFHVAVLEIKRAPKPVIAAINGPAAGGGFSTALACDFRIMAQSAVMKQAYTSSALGIDGGGTYSLPRLVGLARAMEIAAFDRPIPADQALEWGLVNKVVPDGEEVRVALDMAAELVGRSNHAFALAKRQLNDSFTTDFETQLQWEREGLEASLSHPDGREGLAAFTEKRKPVFG